MKIQLCILLLILLTSCSREKEFLFLVTNNTGYTIRQLEIGNDKVRIASGTALQPVYIRYKHFPLSPSEPMLGYGVRFYEDSAGVYENTMGKVIAVGNLDPNNSIRIELKAAPDPAHPFDIFEVLINK